MNIFTAMRDLLRRRLAPPPSTLRNKPGGMAYINWTFEEGDGGAELINRVVQTVKRTNGDFWVIDPPQTYVCTHRAKNAHTGLEFNEGDVIRTLAIKDSCLTPVRNPGDGERSEELAWLPPVPAGEPRKVVA